MSRPPPEHAPGSTGPASASGTDAAADPGIECMRRLQNGDESAFDELIQHYESAVFHFLRAGIADAGRAEDLTQDVFVRVYRSRRRYRPTARFKTWLFTIANRLMLNEIRAVRRRRRVFAEAPQSFPRGDSSRSEDEFWGMVADASGEDPGARAERKELEETVKKLIESLPPNQRAAIELQKSQALSYRDMSEVLGVSPMAVKSLLVRARERLKEGVERHMSGVSETRKES